MAAYRIGTRGSALATTQTRWVAEALQAASQDEFHEEIITTAGDVTTGSLASLGGTGVFASALRQAVINGDVDLAVHSLKDLPAAQPAELAIAAIPQRADVRDALCARDGMTLQQLPAGAKIGTGSPRRVAQIKAVRPDLELVDIRGNVHTRLARVAGYEHHHDNAPAAKGAPRGDLDAVVLACAGLDRLGESWAITERLDPAVITPAPGQAALAVEISSTAEHPTEFSTALAAISDVSAVLETTAERALLRRLEAGCAAPIGALARYENGYLSLNAVVGSMDGKRIIRQEATLELSQFDAMGGSKAAAADELGVMVAEMLVAEGADLLPPGPERGGR